MSEALERAAAAMWHKRADEPLQVGKFKEPMDYRSYGDLGETAHITLRGYARAALLAFLDESDEAMVRKVAYAIMGDPETPLAGVWAGEAKAVIRALRGLAGPDDAGGVRG